MTYTTYIYCLYHDTKEAFIVDTITGRNKESSLKKAKDLCQRYNEQWEKLIQISYCINDGVKVGMIGEVVDVVKDGANVKHSNFKWRWWSFNDYDLDLLED